MPSPENVVGTQEAEPSEVSESFRKINDLESVRAAVVDAAGVSSGLWISYLFVLFYFLVAAGGVTHRDLFLENPVKLPFLGVDLPLTGFFWLGPSLFVIVHAYVMLHFALFAGKVGILDEELRKQIEDNDTRTQFRQKLPINIFVQFLSGPSEVRKGFIGFMLRLIALITLVLGPIFLLVFFELKFLPYHDQLITWSQRIALLVDLALLWSFWPGIVHGGSTAPMQIRMNGRTAGLLAFITGSSFFFVFFIATFPGELLERNIPTFAVRDWLIGGNIDHKTRKPISFLTNRLIVSGVDVIDHTKFDTDAKVLAGPITISLRSRHLEQADLTGADLRRADLVGVRLQRAQLGEAKFQSADLTGANLEGANLGSANFEGASLSLASLQGVEGTNTSFLGADLRGAVFRGAILEHVDMRMSNLDSADFGAAYLAHSDLAGAQPRLARFDGADLNDTDLPGTDFEGATFRGTSIADGDMWRADIRYAHRYETLVSNISIDPSRICIASEKSPCVEDQYFSLHPTIIIESRNKYKYLNKINIIQILDPHQELSNESEMAQGWTTAVGSNEYAETLKRVTGYSWERDKAWIELGCDHEGSPYVLEGIIKRAEQNLWQEFRPQISRAFLSKDCEGARRVSAAARKELIDIKNKEENDRSNK